MGLEERLDSLRIRSISDGEKQRLKRKRKQEGVKFKGTWRAVNAVSGTEVIF